jgi:GT2 family glycosyltransferase
MPEERSSLAVSVPKFDERHYLETNPGVKTAIKIGPAKDALDHYLRFGIDENRYSLIRREPAALTAAVERFLVSQSGFCLLIGWIADEGCDQPRYRLLGGEFNVEFPGEATFRVARSDVEAHLKSGAFDYGFVAFGRSPSRSLLKQSVLFQVTAAGGTFQTKITPEIVSDKRLLDTLLEVVATCQAHAGRECALSSFLAGMSGRTAIELFQSHVDTATSDHYVETFGARPVTHSFVTVLFGSTEPVMVQPMLFRAANVDFGEWIYVCNSPEDADTVLRSARLMSELYDVMITVIVMGDNAGFGAANNVAIQYAASDRILIINPDVYPLAAHAAQLRQVLAEADFGTTLWGGLLFYDDDNLMHSGMYLEQDVFVRRNSLNRVEGPGVVTPQCSLLRVEHYDKGVPFEERLWQAPKDVPAITGAVMAFDKRQFQKIAGFSTRYIYGHYEDADLSLRWGREVGSVAIHPLIRLVHLEGQGSRARGEQYRGAAIANRHFFSARHGELFAQNRAELSKSVELAPENAG